MSGLTQYGFTRDRLDAILADLKSRLQAVYGSDIVIDERSTDGQALAIEAELAADLWQALEDVYNAGDPNAAVGQALFRLGAFCGITWKEGNYAEVPLQVQVRTGETLPALGALVEDVVTGAQYTNTTEVASTDSATWRSVTGRAVKHGTPKSFAGNVTKIAVSRYELLAVRNLSDGSTGVPPETQAQFRVRRARSVANPSQGMTDGLRAALGNLSGVGRVKVHENTTSQWASVQAGDNALPPHSIAVVVENNDAGVAGAIWLRKSQGVTLVGATTAYVTDSAGVSQPMRYAVASDNPTQLAVNITYRELPGQGFGGSEGEGIVKAALAAWVAANVDIGALFNIYDLVNVIHTAVVGSGGGKAIDIESFQCGVRGGSMSGINVAIPWNSVAVLNEADISMTAV